MIPAHLMKKAKSMGNAMFKSSGRSLFGAANPGATSTTSRDNQSVM